MTNNGVACRSHDARRGRCVADEDKRTRGSRSSGSSGPLRPTHHATEIPGCETRERNHTTTRERTQRTERIERTQANPASRKLKRGQLTVNRSPGESFLNGKTCGNSHSRQSEATKHQNQIKTAARDVTEGNCRAPFQEGKSDRTALLQCRYKFTMRALYVTEHYRLKPREGDTNPSQKIHGFLKVFEISLSWKKEKGKRNGVPIVFNSKTWTSPASDPVFEASAGALTFLQTSRQTTGVPTAS